MGHVETEMSFSSWPFSDKNCPKLSTGFCRVAQSSHPLLIYSPESTLASACLFFEADAKLTLNT